MGANPRPVIEDVGTPFEGDLCDCHDAEGDAIDDMSMKFDTQHVVQELMQQVRELSLRLRPSMLDDLGLVPALLWLFDRYSSRSDIKVRFKSDGVEGRYPQEVETAAYRIVQEALTNVARHAQVSSVSVKLGLKKGALVIEVVDRGAGFDPLRVFSAGLSSGVEGMRERARLLDGDLIVDSKIGKGTRLMATIPLPIDQPDPLEPAS